MSFDFFQLSTFLLFFFFKILFTYLTKRNRVRKGTQVGEQEREKQAPCDVGLHPRTLGS